MINSEYRVYLLDGTARYFLGKNKTVVLNEIKSFGGDRDKAIEYIENIEDKNGDEHVVLEVFK